MASNNRLYRNFVILQEDERGYVNASDKTLSGYSKIEARGDDCKISFYAQNLRKDSDDYYMMVICSKKDKKQIINLGAMEINDTGKGESTREYNINNIGGLDLQYDKISGTAIAKIVEGNPIFVMYGFLNGQQPSENWKNYSVVRAMDLKPKAIDKDRKKESKKTETKREETKILENSVKSNEKKMEETNIKDIEEERVGSKEEDKIVKDEVKTEVKKQYFERENLRGKFEDYEDEIEAIKEFNPIDQKIRGSIGEYFESIAEGFEREYNNIDDLKYTKWYKVPVNNLHEMCNMSNYNKYTLAYYPMLNYYPYIKKYGYFMLGYKCDSTGNLKHIIYGVPGKKDKDEQPYDGRTGFVTWVNLKDNDKSGCWLMFYDFKNSTVVVPMQ